EEGAAIELSMTSGNEMAIIVGAGQAALPSAAGAAPGGRGGANAYAMTAPKSIPQVTVSIEHYNRLVRMAQQNVPITMEADLQVQYVTEDPNAYNTIAEIPGTDLKDEIVMLGAHIDSWHMGDGATDNGTGVAECMEAVRIIKGLGIKPRRTIRVGLWSGEEEGLLGSRAYVRQHFGALPGNLIGSRGGRGGGGRGGAETEPAAASAPATTSAPATRVGLLPDAAKFSCYFNTDEGGGRFRGVYASDNSAAAEIMRQYLAPVKDLGPSVVSPGHATGSDHQSFESAGLPAFQFMPDPIDYWAGTWHTSQDLYDHVVPDDIKAASVVMATCVYQAAMADEKMPRRQ
ncbi:MAG TPA: M20/M25/M40 family metallo-hydrolase, partial [Phycisphaerae bacterium]|nr:M20/M25/M40 family metallo-hydrolase [Phycisphaerae bacterium]